MIVFTDVVGVGAGGPDKIYVDLGESGAGGSASNSFFAATDFQLYMFASNNYRPLIEGLGASIASDNGWAKNFSFGSSISTSDNGSLFLNDPSGSNPNWAYGTRGYLGVQFTAGTNGLVNGWIDVLYGPYLTVYGFAYETSGGPIAAGATAIPEPATATLAVGLLAAGVVLYLKRREQARAA
ncbi:MAG: hypothetical protein PSW75_00990 [bacterium]|nr:hypothetical protein [bacterium]MDI1336762.1 hypothetical protein [Lacunisphaera sp.]